MPTKIVINDARQPKTTTPTADNVPLGAVVVYPTEDGGTRRGVVINRNQTTVSIQDGETIARVRGEDRARIVMLARSTDEYTTRVARTAQELRARHNWCSVPNELVRKLNSTPALGTTGQLHVHVTATQTHVVQPTDITLRRKAEFEKMLRDAYIIQSPGWFNTRSFTPLEEPNLKHVLTLVDPEISAAVDTPE